MSDVDFTNAPATMTIVTAPTAAVTIQAGLVNGLTIVTDEPGETTVEPGGNNVLTIQQSGRAGAPGPTGATGPTGPMGPQGPAGPSGGLAVVKTAQGALNGQYAVMATGDDTVAYPDITQVNDVLSIIGITTGAAADGAQVSVQGSGDLSDSGWSWTPGLPVYVAQGGVLTQTVPTSGYLLRVGVAVASDQIFIRFAPPILLL